MSTRSGLVLCCLLSATACKRDGAAPPAPPTPSATPAAASQRLELTPPLAVPAPTVGASPTATGLSTPGVGDTVRAADYTLTLDVVKECKVEPPFQPKEGSIKLGVHLAIEGTGERDVPVSPFHAGLDDSAGNHYTTTLAGCRPILSSVRVAKGEKTEGWVSFEVPKSATGLVLAYDPTVIGGARQPVRVSLNR